MNLAARCLTLRDIPESDSGISRMPYLPKEKIALAMQEIQPDEQPAPTADHKISVLVIDDQPHVLRGLIELVKDSGIAKVVASETNGEDALTSAFEHRPDLIMLDVSLPKMSGIEIAKKLIADWKEVRILAVSAHSNDIYVKSMLAAGARGYLLKDNTSNELKPAIESIMSGGFWIGHGLTYPPNIEQS